MSCNTVLKLKMELLRLGLNSHGRKEELKKRVEDSRKGRVDDSGKLVNVKVAFLRPMGYKNLKEFCEDDECFYIARKGVVFVDGCRYPKSQSVWANPFKVGDDRESCLEKYEVYIREKIDSGEADLEELRGKVLGCWCKPERCHGEVLLKLLNE
jgi:hypothetical protein